MLTAGAELWYTADYPPAITFGAAGWVPVGLGSAGYAAVDTSGENPYYPDEDVWHLSTNQTFAAGAAGWVPVGLSNGTFGVVDTSGDNTKYPGADVWHLSTGPVFPYGAAGWVPVGLDDGTFGVVDTSGDDPTYPAYAGDDVWYLSTNQIFPAGNAGWVPVGLGNDGFGVVDTSGNDPNHPGADVWHLSNFQTVAYGAAGWVPVGYVYGGFAVVDESGGSAAAPVPLGFQNWSGYAVDTIPGAVDDVRGTWYVPAVSGVGSDYSATWVGIDGDQYDPYDYGQQILEQVGTTGDVNPTDGLPPYHAWYEMLPGPQVPVAAAVNPSGMMVPAVVNPGDLIAAEVTYVGGGMFNVDISDLGPYGVEQWNYNNTVPGPSGAPRSSAEWIEEAPAVNNVQSTLSNFGSVTFSNMEATISGGTTPVNIGDIDDLGNIDHLYTMTDMNGGMATASQLNPAGNGFTVSYYPTGSTTPTIPPPSAGPFVPYYGPGLLLSNDPSTASTPLLPSPFTPVNAVVGVPSLIPLTTGSDLTAQAAQPSMDPFITLIVRKLPNHGSHRSSFSSLLSSEDGFQGR